jgi:hypothetical protein
LGDILYIASTSDGRRKGAGEVCLRDMFPKGPLGES